MKKKIDQYIEYEDGTRVALGPDDVPELGREFFQNAKRFSDLPVEMQQALQSLKKPGRPRKAVPRQTVTLRVEPDVLEAFKGAGKGWQTRMNAVLREHMPR